MRDGFGAAESQEQADFRVVENGRLARGVFFDTIRAEGWICLLYTSQSHQIAEKIIGPSDRNCSKSKK